MSPEQRAALIHKIGTVPEKDDPFSSRPHLDELAEKVATELIAADVRWRQDEEPFQDEFLEGQRDAYALVMSLINGWDFDAIFKQLDAAQDWAA